MSELTELEKELHQKLYEKGFIRWLDTSNQHTQALNRLIKKGYAIYDGESRDWYPVNNPQTGADKSQNGTT